MTYKPQLTKPKGPNPYYIKKPDGFSPCILGNNSRGQRDPILNVLPNCVGYATGRFNEIGNYGSIKYAPKGNAANFINEAKRLGLKVTNEPSLGGIMVWSGGKGGAGHVAVCEVKYKDGTVACGESEWNGRAFTTYRRGGKNYTDGCAWMKTGYAYIGCINNPAVEEEEMITDIKVKDTNTGEVLTLKGIYKDGKNYIQLADLSNHQYALVGWDGSYPTLTKVKKCCCGK